ncbi:hypothetical protein, partial [Leptospira weilii]
HNSAAASLWIGITQRLPLYGSAARSQHRIAFAFCYTELTLILILIFSGFTHFITNPQILGSE